MKMKWIVISAVVLAVVCLVADFVSWKMEKPPQASSSNRVPDSDTAIRIAMAVASPVYGKGTIDRERPFSTELTNGRWTVRGSIPVPSYLRWLNWKGGGVVVRIDQADGRIIDMTHEK